METEIDLDKKIIEFKKDPHRIKVKQAWERHAEFLKLYPFREKPEEIDRLTPEKIYNPGKEYFVDWIEHKLKALGHLAIGSAKVWKNARDNSDTFKDLLKIVVDDSKSIADKIDAHWEDIKGFGGDRHIAKKILFCYYPKETFPAFKTEDLEDLSEPLGLEYQNESYKKYGQAYELLSVGQKFELFNDLFLAFKNKNDKIRAWDNVSFGHFLYTNFPVTRLSGRVGGDKESKPVKKGKRLLKPFSDYGLIAEPQFEQEIVFLFSKFHIKLGFPMIIKIAPAFPDALALNEKKEHKKIEFEVKSSDFINHKHDPKACDYIVCWEDDLSEDQKKRKELPEVISLKEELGE